MKRNKTTGKKLLNLATEVNRWYVVNSLLTYMNKIDDDRINRFHEIAGYCHKNYITFNEMIAMQEEEITALVFSDNFLDGFYKYYKRDSSIYYGPDGNKYTRALELEFYTN